MPQYKVLTKSYINNSIVEEGEVVEYNGKPGSNLELIKTKGKPKAAAVDEPKQDEEAAS